MSDQGQVTLVMADRVASIVFDRPQAYNSMTKKMYEELVSVCDTVRANADIRVVTFRGAGGKAFVSGSDISGFESFRDGSDGVRYEAEMDRYYEAILGIAVPTIAIIDGFAVGGGLRAAAYCDIRIASAKARFGIPIARTLGNCLSMVNYARLVGAFGEGRAKRMLYLAELLDAREALEAGFLARVVAPEELDAAADEVVATILANAPVTMRISKAALGRIADGHMDDGRDLIEACYSSKDFKIGVSAFLNKTKPEWTGS